MGALADLVDHHAAALLRDGPYEAPGAAVVAALPRLLDALAAGAPLDGPAGALGLHVLRTEGRTVLHPPRPGGAPWVLLAAPAGPPGAVIEVPHPQADLHTERIAVDVLDRVPDALLLQAGAHRVAAGPRREPDRFDRAKYPADVAKRADALFSRVVEGLLVRRGSPQVQLHGFADREGVDVVLSPGAAPDGPLTARLAAALAAQGLPSCTPDDAGCADLAGRLNVQGLAAAQHGTAFAHLELSRSVREDPAGRERVAEAIAQALAALGC